MSEKIWLFGDSYADQNNNNDPNSWVRRLQRLGYDIDNFAVAGSGPEYQLSLFYNQMNTTSSTKLKEINLIFLISACNRINFSFLNPRDQIIKPKITFFKFKPSKMELEILEKYPNYMNFLEDFYRYYFMHNNNSSMLIEKNVGLLSLYKDQFKSILAWPIFDSVNRAFSYTDTFCVPSLRMYEIDTEESEQESQENIRANHMRPHVHEELANQIERWIMRGKKINIHKFNLLRNK